MSNLSYLKELSVKYQGRVLPRVKDHVPANCVYIGYGTPYSSPLLFGTPDSVEQNVNNCIKFRNACWKRLQQNDVLFKNHLKLLEGKILLYDPHTVVSDEMFSHGLILLACVDWMNGEDSTDTTEPNTPEEQVQYSNEDTKSN